MSGLSSFRRMGFLLALVVAGCATAKDDRALATVAIAPDMNMGLPRTADLGRTVDAVQRVTARRAESVHVFEVRLRATAERVQLAGTDPAGRRAMTIDWRDGQLAVERAPWLPDGVRPENILADLVLVFWPENALRAVLAETQASLTVEPGTGTRIVRHKGRDRVTVRYDGPGDPWSGVARLRNAAWEYELDIRSMIVAP
jgi:hypothetical protein